MPTETTDALPKAGCGILGRYPIITILVFAGVGMGIGVGLNYWEPEDPETKDKVLKWIGLVGVLFIRVLKAVVLPLVFVNVALSVVDMMNLGSASSVGWWTIGLYLSTTVFASIIGIISIVMFQSKFTQETFPEDEPSYVTLECNEPGAFLAEGENGAISCTSNYASEDDIEFIMTDVNGAFVSSPSGSVAEISLSDTIYSGIFIKIVPENVFVVFYDANFAAVAFMAIFFGAALGRVIMKHDLKDGQSILMNFLNEMNLVLLLLINWVIIVTPFAVLSLIAKAIGSNENLSDSFENVGYLVAATMVANFLHYMIVYVGLFGLLTKSNPFKYLRKIVPAQTFAFACSSSAATIPVTLQCLKNTGVVPDTIARFVIPLGATINMDGGAIYFPCACIWLAYLNGIKPDVASYFLLIIISTIGSAGTAPVPSASLVLIITAYNTVFNTTGVPEGFSYILAIDWFMDRLRTTLNVTGDCVVTGIVAHHSPNQEEFEKVHDHHYDEAEKPEDPTSQLTSEEIHDGEELEEVKPGQTENP